MIDGVHANSLKLEGIHQENMMKRLLSVLDDPNIQDEILARMLSFTLASFCNSLNTQRGTLAYLGIGSLITGLCNDSVLAMIRDAWREMKDTGERGEAVKKLREYLEGREDLAGSSNL